VCTVLGNQEVTLVRTFFGIWLVLWIPAIAVGGDCGFPNDVVTTDHYFYGASSDQGAVGDVVAVELSVTLDAIQLVLDNREFRPYGFILVGCYDGEALEILEQVQYSEFYDEFALFSIFYPEGGEAGRLPGHPGGTFILGAGFQAGAADRFLSAGSAFPLVTLYFRIRSAAQDEIAIRFCDSTRVGVGCESNTLDYTTVRGLREDYRTLSTRHVPGIIRILPGEPTRPDPPSLPPNATIYPEAPTPETAAIHFELEGPPVAAPGATEVPFRLFVTSNHEFSGFMSGLRFPAEHLELARVEEHTRPGVLAIDNEPFDVDFDSGGFGLLMANSRRRVGQEQERVHLATLYFNVKEAARTAGEVRLHFERFDNFRNWLAIWHRNGQDTSHLPITAEVTPLVVADGLLQIQAVATRLGDVNLDYAVDLSDAVNLLGTLFLGAEPIVCPQAADFNEDEEVNLSDAVSILNHLFRGWPGPAEREVFCR
jgi:hypothetical protein